MGLRSKHNGPRGSSDFTLHVSATCKGWDLDPTNADLKLSKYSWHQQTIQLQGLNGMISYFTGGVHIF